MFGRASVWVAAVDEPLQGRAALFDLPPTHQRTDERRSLPLVMSVDLGHRGTEALAKLDLQRVDLLSLLLQVARFAEVKAQLDQADKRVHLANVTRESSRPSWCGRAPARRPP